LRHGNSLKFCVYAIVRQTANLPIQWKSRRKSVKPSRHARDVEAAENNRVKVKLHSPQRAITPGHAALFYQDDLVVGGGWIMR
jgi:tRNA U34 2-thiouridine synthase MnmA/TrmU